MFLLMRMLRLLPMPQQRHKAKVSVILMSPRLKEMEVPAKVTPMMKKKVAKTLTFLKLKQTKMRKRL